jgi:hypothetical protein
LSKNPARFYKALNLASHLFGSTSANSYDLAGAIKCLMVATTSPFFSLVKERLGERREQ